MKLFVTKVVTEVPRKERWGGGGERGKFSKKRI